MANNNGFSMNPCHCPRCKRRLPQINNRSVNSNLIAVTKHKLLSRSRKEEKRKGETQHNNDKMVRNKNLIKPFLEPMKSRNGVRGDDGIVFKKEIEMPYFESYRLACEYYGTRPIKSIDEAIKQQMTSLDLHHMHLRSAEFKALSIMFVYNYNIQNLNLEDTFLKHFDDVEFLKICLLENNYVTDVNLSNNNFDSAKVVSQVAELIQYSRTITRLNLESTNLRDHHTIYLKPALLKNEYLTELNLSHNSFGSNGGKMFADVIKTNVRLEKMDISWNNLRPRDTSLILRSLESNYTLLELNLAFNGLDDVASEHLGKSLIKNRTLVHLNVANNRISNDGASDIAVGLAHNTSLKTFNISNNPITATGIRYILAAIIQNGTLFTLHMKGISPDSMCVQGIEYLQRNGTTVDLDEGKVCSREYRPRTGDVVSFQGDLCKRIRQYLIKERLRARDLFNIWDKQKAGKLCYNDIVEGLNDAGILVTVFQVEEFIRKLDINKDGKLSPNEFCGILHIHHENSAYPPKCSGRGSENLCLL